MDVDGLRDLAIRALRNAYAVHEKLGASGEELVEKNQFGDTALRADIEAEKAVIQTFADAKVSIKIVSEEHGSTVIGENPQMLAILDGIDGTSVYKQARGTGRYGTMLGLFSSVNPVYDDYLFSGVMEHSANTLFYAVKGKGAFLQKEVSQKIFCSQAESFSTDSRIRIDDHWETNTKFFSEKLKDYSLECADASCVHYVDVATGDADLALECTRKNNLEIAIAYGLITESGGVMVTPDNESLGPKKYFEFGQDTHILIITAATKQLATELIQYLEESYLPT